MVTVLREQGCGLDPHVGFMCVETHFSIISEHCFYVGIFISFLGKNVVLQSSCVVEESKPTRSYGVHRYLL